MFVEPGHVLLFPLIEQFGIGLTVTVPDAGTDGHRGLGPEFGVITTVYVPATVAEKLATFPGGVAPLGTVHE